jgi:hypothetical protein
MDHMELPALGRSSPVICTIRVWVQAMATHWNFATLEFQGLAL